MVCKLPIEDYSAFKHMDKIRTYNFLYNSNCNVFKSVLLTDKPTLTEVEVIRSHLSSDYFMLRYQYIRPTPFHKCGGNKYPINQEIINDLWDANAYIWLMEPIDRRKNLYGINIMVNALINKVIFEIVGQGFDVSDINRGRLRPHEIIETVFPIYKGYYSEIWKYMKVSIIDQKAYIETISSRKRFLNQQRVNFDEIIFPDFFNPLPLYYYYEMYDGIENISQNINSDSYCISCSIDEKGTLIYWDIQIPEEKVKYY